MNGAALKALVFYSDSRHSFPHVAREVLTSSTLFQFSNTAASTHYFAVIDDIIQNQVFLFNCVSIYSIFVVNKDETCLILRHTHYLLKPHV